ncbi:hypothetical protein L1887_09824 [Cichorium endivia]|nr:hypothetical protein L1887_09824 [Cichorium endivia]
MSDEVVVNGAGADVDVEIAAKEEKSDGTMNQTVEKLMQKLAILEQEKQELINGKELATERIKELEDEIKMSESDKRALSSIAARAAELETEVSRLQHDLISSISDGQESNAELSELKRVVEELKKSESEKEEKLDVIENERNLLLERLNKEAEKLKDEENQIRELEKKIEGFETRESIHKSERLKVEEEAKAKISEKDEQIQSLSRMIDEFQSVIVKNRAEMEKSEKEKEELEIGKNDLEAQLKNSESKVKEMEHRLDQLQQELEAYEKINSVLKEKLVEDTNGIGAERGIDFNGDEKRLMGSKLDWPIIAVGTGAIATVALVYFRHAKF